MEDNEYNPEEGFEGVADENLNKTGASEKARRNYPKYVKGQKNEWIGMVQHQQEIGDELAKIEREIRILTAKTLNTEYEKNQLFLFEKKKRQLQEKQREAEDMMAKRKMYEQDLSQFKQDKLMMQNHITQTYDKLVQEKHEVLGKYKSAEQDLERAILEDNFRKLEQQQRVALEKKDRERSMALSAIQDKEQARVMRNFDQLKQRNEVNEMNKMSEMRELIKDENYKNFFKLCADNQAYYQDLHRSQVLNPNLERQGRIQQMIEKNIDEENRKKLQNELDRLKKKQEGHQMTRNINEIQIMEKQKQKELEKMEKQVQNEARLKDLQEYNNFLNYKKNQKNNQMQDYKQKLEAQFDEKKNNDMNLMRMTRNEKKLNYNDLQAYKDIDHSLYAMLPGYSPQIGALKVPKNDPLANLDDPNATNKNAMISPNKISAKALVQQHFNKGNNNNAFTLPNEPINNRAEYSKNTNSASLLYGHNPILNPTPHNIQNPYLAKEFAQRKNFLSQMGQNSLV